VNDSTQMNTRRRLADGLVIRYAEADGTPDETVLLVNPWPESLFAWHTIWTRLAKTARLVAIDLPGFGQSERRAELLSPRAMGKFLLRLVDEWGLGRPHLVGPDVGTGAVLFALSEDPDGFPSAVVGSGGAAFPLEVTGALKDIIEAPDLSAFRALDGRDIVAQALEGIERHTLLSRPRSRSSPAATTRSCRQATPSSCTRGCPAASSTSSTPATSPGRTVRMTTSS
jgi:pimeloyl-ACP methyl ester carboxylesterase